VAKQASNQQPVAFDQIVDREGLHALCQQLRGVPRIGFDTEFVSEDTYRPDLCLIQVAAQGVQAVIDTRAIDDITPFWEVLTEGDHETIVHAGREECRFMMQAVGKRPARLIDLQIAAGLMGMEYPAAYGTLVSKILGKTLPKGETRTDWRKRPLTQRQLEYAIQDVLYLEPIWTNIEKRLRELGRIQWMDAEITAWQDDLAEFETQERWRRVKGSNGLSSRSLAVLRELWRWREREAEMLDKPARRILRDDLLVEIAKRQHADERSIRAVRGMERRNLQRSIVDIAEAVALGLEAKPDEIPAKPKRATLPPFNVLGQLLTTVLGDICRSNEVAPMLVGTAQDVRDLIAYRLDLVPETAEVPVLDRGWRGEIVGSVLDDMLAGKLAIRVGQPLDESPLTYEK
jgi:ribonuclease D